MQADGQEESQEPGHHPPRIAPLGWINALRALQRPKSNGRPPLKEDFISLLPVEPQKETFQLTYYRLRPPSLQRYSTDTKYVLGNCNSRHNPRSSIPSPSSLTTKLSTNKRPRNWWTAQVLFFRIPRIKSVVGSGFKGPVSQSQQSHWHWAGGLIGKCPSWPQEWGSHNGKSHAFVQLLNSVTSLHCPSTLANK